MSSAIIPPPPILAALLSLPLLPALLAILGHGCWRVGRLGLRFRVAAAATAGLWVLLTFAAGARWAPGAPQPDDLLAGLLILATGIWAAFCAWSLLAWSFTLSMLMALVEAGGPLDLDAWIDRFAGSRGLDAFLHDRLAVLFALGVARRTGDVVTVTSPRGLLVARLADVAARVFGMGR
jgi:hypothetical protein